MKFTLDSCSDKYPDGYGKEPKQIIEINTLEELLNHVKKEGHPVIIAERIDDEWELETYDDYRE